MLVSAVFVEGSNVGTVDAQGRADMHARYSFLGLLAAAFLSSSAALLGATGCGGETESSNDSQSRDPGNLDEVAPASGEVFLLNSGGVLDLVRVDLATGKRGRIAPTIPVESSETAFILTWMSTDASRVVVDVPTKARGDKLLALDRLPDGSAQWRTLAEDAMFVRVSEDASLVTFATGGNGKYVMHLVRYDGENVADIDATESSPANVYPQIAAMSPEGRWAIVSRSSKDLAAFAIPERGAARGPAMPPTQGGLNVLCSTPSTFIATSVGASTGADAFWFEPTFTSIEVEGFLSKRSKITSRLNSRTCGFQVDGDSDSIRTVSIIDDQVLSRGFTFDGKLGQLLDATSEHWLLLDAHFRTAGLTLGSTKTSATIATYQPLPVVRAIPAGHEAHRMVEVLAHSLGSDRQTIVARVRTDFARIDPPAGESPTPLEESNELWVVEGGKTVSTVRLAEGPWVDATGWPAIPRNYRFSKDGKHLYWTAGDTEGKLRVHVRDLPNGDNERVLDGTLFTASRTY